MVGLTQNRSIQDEKLIEAVFQTHHSPESRAASTTVYGATTTNLIIDARPTTNAMANTAKGAGTENMDHYKEGKKAYLGIDHIHAMRESLGRVVEALREADTLLASINNDLPEQLPDLRVLDRAALRRSGWLRHISAIMQGTLLITRNVHVNSSHVLIHCSDGWDRTSQLAALSQLCLDPYYRTIRGFEILIEKDWVSFGHKFLDRCGHLSSEKFFLSSNEPANAGSGADAAQAFLASVQNRFASQQHIKETSPVFHQFLESVRQVQRQFPDRFEFNERFLRQLYYHLYSCQFGTFLYNSERERRVGDGAPPPCERTISVWDFFNSPAEMVQNVNPTYNPSLDNPTSRAAGADMGVLFPNPKNVRFWNELYGRTDDEMNGRIQTIQARGVEVIGPNENVDEDPELQMSDSPPVVSLPLPPSPSKSAMSLLPQRSTSMTPVTSRSAHSSRELSMSTPEMLTRPGPPRAESYSGSLSTSPSSLTIRPTRTPSPSPLASPNRTRIKPPDFLSGSGVKSVWGKLSSNASAAFSVVQDAYVGVAKDLRNTGSGDNEPSGKADELRGRETLSAWGEEAPFSPVVRRLDSLSLSSNPWAPQGSERVPPERSTPSVLEENPWGVDSLSSTSTNSLGSLTLPDDPTVSRPAPRMAPLYSKMKATEEPPPPPNVAPDSASGSDPLGVGLHI
jgi:myotubularin-related protein 6/7/8